MVGRTRLVLLFGSKMFILRFGLTMLVLIRGGTMLVLMVFRSNNVGLKGLSYTLVLRFGLTRWSCSK